MKLIELSEKGFNKLNRSKSIKKQNASWKTTYETSTFISTSLFYVTKRSDLNTAAEPGN